MRMFLAIIVCKLLRFIGKLVGKGSSLPGQYALKLCPDVLGRVKLPPYIIAVTGSNGKTSTVEMIASILRAAGKDVVYNAEGSNQIEGVTTLILSRSTLGGKVKGDVLLLESDERYARLSFRHFHPTHFVITNLYRDQLTRNGHPEWVFASILPAIHPETTLVLNADDPLVSRFAQGHDPEKVKWFGLERCSISTDTPRGVYDDGARCPVCRGRMVYSCYHYHHIGHYHCESCGYSRHKPDFAVTDLDLKEGRLTIGGDTEIHLSFRSIYNVYNILAAYTAARASGLELPHFNDMLAAFNPENGRMERFRVKETDITLNLAKNPAGFNQNISAVMQDETLKDVIIVINDNAQDGIDVSWLWDVDFDRFKEANVNSVTVSGIRCQDMRLRLKYVDIPSMLEADVEKAVCERVENGCGNLYVLVNYTALFSTRNVLKRLEEEK